MSTIYIHKGDSTVFADVTKFMTFNIDTELDLTGWQAVFTLGGITKKITDISSKSFEVILTAQDTANLFYGKYSGILKLIDSNGNIKTISNGIPFNITNEVVGNEPSNIGVGVPQSCEINIEIIIGTPYNKSSVTSVNGQTGEVVLTAQDVGALPDTTVIPTLVSQLQNDMDYATRTEIIQEWENQREILQEETQNQILVLREVSDEEQDTITEIKESIEQGKAVYIGDSEPTEDIFDIWVDPNDNDIYLDIKEVKEQLPNKQDKLTAGDGIKIVNNVISATGGSGHDIFVSGYNIFDIVYKDHMLSYEETEGFAPLGSYVCKEAIAGSRYGYADFYNQCVQEYNEATTTETVNGVTVKVSSNGHKFYNIADKSAIDTFYSSYGMAWFYGIDTENERVFLPRNDYLNKYVANGEYPVKGNGMTLGLTNGTDNGGIQKLASRDLEIDTAEYGIPVSTTTVNDANIYGAFGITTDPTKSGIITTINNISNNLIPYMVVGNTTTQSAVTDVIDITTSENDTIPLFTGMYFDFTPNNASWIKANEQVVSGGIYTTAYEDLVNELTSSKYNIKVVDVANMQTGVDYSEYWKVNQTDMTFTCPISTGERILIEKKEPTTDDSSWYNLYSDGWLEQGGLVGTSTTSGYPIHTVNLLKTFANTNFNVQVTGRYTKDTNSGTNYCSARTTSSITIVSVGYGSDWQASGYAEIQTPTNFYFKVANAVQNLELLNVGEVMESLSGKVDVSNTQWAVNACIPSLSGKVDVSNTQWAVNACMPDYTAGITIPFPTDSNYFTSPTDGIAVLYVPEIEAKVNILYINGQQTSFRVNGAETYRDLSSLVVPLSKNDIIAFDTDIYNNSYSGTFYPLKGAI